MKREKISELTTNRLSVYLRCVNELAAAGIRTVSSQELAEQFNLNSAQIRKDLGYFGEFGVRGTGYYIEDLRAHLTKMRLALVQRDTLRAQGLLATDGIGEASVQIGDGDLFVGVVSGIRLARKPHAEGNRARQSLRVSAAARDGGRIVLARRAPVSLHEAAHQLRLARSTDAAS